VTFKPRLWEPIAWILTFGNVVAVWFPAPVAPWHAATHAVLAVLFGLWAQHLRRRGQATAPDASMAERLGDMEARLAEVDKLRDIEARVAELEERLDFTERALIDVRARAQVPPKA
jgi:hypothetical protein